MKDNKKTAESFDKTTSSIIKNAFSGTKKAIKGAKLGAKAVKLIATFLSSVFGSIGIVILIFIIVVAAVLSFAVAAIFPSYYNDGNMTFDDESLGNACNVQQSKVYEKMQQVWDKMIDRLDEEMDAKIASLFDGDYSIASSDITKDKTSDTSWTYTAEVVNTDKEGEIYRTVVSIPIQLQLDSPEQLINTIAGYIEANYATVYTYNDLMPDLQKTVDNKKTINIKIDSSDNNGDVVTSESCTAHGGTVENQKCMNYTYTPKQKKVTKTGTCTYQDGNWETTDDETHTCSNEEWARKKHITETSVNSSPTDGSTYTYSYFETKENKEINLENFDLDDFDDVIDAYIDSNTLMYYTIPDGWEDGLPSEKETDEQKVTKDITCTKETEGCIFDTETSEIGHMTISKTIYVYTKRAELSSPVKIDVGTNVDSSDSKFLKEEREKTIKNIELLAENKGESANGEYEFNKSVSYMVDTLNFLCPNYNINLSLITGSTYSSFDAISSAVDAPEVFGNQNYWYDSSSGDMWDRAQLGRQDVYNAIWSYDAYLIQSGKVTQSGWWGGAEQGTPQCTDFVHARFYAQYGYDCGSGNGIEMAAKTVALYPDKFTNGTINGALTIKAGSIISKPENNAYGHVGFVEAVETDDSGKITSITISDANFGGAGVPGGVRLMCKYTWEQFVECWGLNCQFAVPIN